MVVWFLVSKREFINAVLKSHFQLLFSDNGPRVGNKWRGSVGLELVNWWPKNSFNKACLNILRAENIRCIGVRLSKKQDNKVGTKGDNGVGIRGDNEVGIGKDDKLGTKRLDNKSGTRR